VFDTAIETNMEKIWNMSCGKESWSQASLPIKHAALGLHSAADLSLPCSCHRLMPVRASSTVYFLLLTCNSLMGM